MKYIVTINDKQYEVEVERGKAVAAYIGEAPAPVAPVAAPAAAPAPVATPAPAAAPAPAAGEGDPICSPMPGTILDVRCQPGQAVQAGDILFILEAMKMENEIFAGKEGVVTSVVTTKGASVDTGAVLATVK